MTPPAESERLRQLLDIEDIKKLKARYCRYLDCDDFSRLRLLFTDDARFDMAGTPLESADAFLEHAVRRAGEGSIEVRQLHIAFMPDIEVTSVSAARGCWRFFVFRDSESANGREAVQIYGNFEENYRKSEGAWQICFMRITSIRVDVLPSDSLSVFPPPVAPLAFDDGS